MTSPAVANRSAGIFASAHVTTRSSASGTLARNARREGSGA